ncbi:MULTISPECIES: flagellar hook-associated protein FlgL [unclassified Oleiphilus]|jgi:flagellar hook-associated protein 3 FlgL|nr:MULTISPECIES: flagellar hook-associated protein FlgL [unclassified Oleiphilus]KZY43738.1 flagellar biosynthesis protein FlgL [Oleiphilus sp. HI0050]KZY76067.1 flagellar biosynthesis protein FlgL [Oleiphilus sp. HI0068]KZY80281.1 flagellar biosynthesis protein FlgL [Oleiphilus sp. HI0069]KZZ12418.1 flagellar biosynthesis protein FlgL [Oleiphilus sp. HI0078]KZZ26061.1 flagellar biosynthesis protein FlgL [Oleiphilus sp. HI0081]KZZ46843.1 flagellar biosynthesis protein FlgL [Oleiphilus sp. HI0
MRISTQQLFNRGLEAIQDVQSDQQKTQLQISTGKKVLTPADDPVASTRILELNQELELNSQFQRNIELARGHLNLQDDLLGSINSVVQRIRELTVTAGNGVLNKSDLSAISTEVKERLSQLAGLMNSQDASGEYLFSGFQGGTEPFQQNVSGTYVYQGDEGRRFVQVEPNVTIASSENGKQIFQDIAVDKNTFYTAANPHNQAVPEARITTGQVIDQELYDQFYPGDMIVTFTSPSEFNVTDKATGRSYLANQAYSQNDPIVVNGVQFEITGTPTAGDSFFIESTEKQGVLSTIEKFIYTLDNFTATEEGRATFDANLESALINLDSAETSILEARSQIGARLNTVETTEEQLKDVELLTEQTLSDLESVDYAEAVSLLSLQQFTLEAAYSSYSQVSSLSLFDRL